MLYMSSYLRYGSIYMSSGGATFYLPDDLLAELDQRRGRLSRSMFLKLILEDAFRRNVELSELLSPRKDAPAQGRKMIAAPVTKAGGAG
jgi:hypothetical protein